MTQSAEDYIAARLARLANKKTPAPANSGPGPTGQSIEAIGEVTPEPRESRNSGRAELEIVHTSFENSKSTDGEHNSATWRALCASIASDPDVGGKDGAALIFGEVRPDKEGKRRHKKDQVVALHALAVDLDDVPTDSLLRIVERLAADKREFFGWPTHTQLARELKPPKDAADVVRVRLVFPLSTPVAGKDWERFWPAAVAALGLSEHADPSCKDSSRLAYVTCPPGGEAGWRVWCGLLRGHGAPLDSAAILASAKPAPSAANQNSEPDLNARGVIDGGLKVPACPLGVSPFAHAEKLCREMPAAISGQGGHVALLRVARAIAWGLQLPPEQTVKLLAELYNPRCAPPWSEFELAHKVADASAEAGSTYARGALLPPPPDSFDHLPLIVQRERRYWLREPSSNDYAVRVRESDLVRKVRDLYGEEELATWRTDDKPVGKTTIEERSRVVDKIVTCYYVPRTTFELANNRLTEGLRTDPDLRARQDANVEAWLTALAGDDLQALKMWIAGCRPELLCAPAPALGIVGPKEAGKSLIAAGLARIWGDACAPVRASVLIDKFNGDLTRCPIVLADERMPEDMSGEDFREKVAARSHSIEPKGKERQVLSGSIRLVVAANNVDRVVRLDGEKCDDDLTAIADRWRLIIVDEARAAQCVAALEPLKLADGSNVNLAAIAEHFLWIQDSVQPHKGRFIGAPPDAKILALLRKSEADRAPELFEVIAEWLRAPWPMNETSADATPERGKPQPEQRRNWPLFEQHGRLYARVGVLGAIVGTTAHDVAKLIRPFAASRARERVKIGETWTMARELNAARLRQALDVEGHG